MDNGMEGMLDTYLFETNSLLDRLDEMLVADEKIVGGRVELREDENSLTALMSGKAKFHIYITPPSPLRLMEYVLEYDISYLSSLLAA